MSELPSWATHEDLLAFYERHRNRLEDLYRSEARFLPWLAGTTASVLDVGCAAGGFCSIWRELAPSVRYEGVDVSPALIELARRLHPEVGFLVGNACEGIALPAGRADVVQALGWLHWVPEQEAALAELWRLAGRFLFFDLRIAMRPEDAGAGRQRLALVGEWDGRTVTPYVTTEWPALAGFLTGLQPQTIYAYGYSGRPAETVDHAPREVCMATFVLERAPGAVERPRVCLDLPLAWPRELEGAVELLPPGALDRLVPPAQRHGGSSGPAADRR